MRYVAEVFEPGPRAQRAPASHHRSTRIARNVFQRLGLPSPSSISKCTSPSATGTSGYIGPCRFSSSHRPVVVALALDDADRLGGTCVRIHAGSPKVVKPPEDVVIEVVRERESGEGRINHLTGRQPPQHAAFEEVLLATEASGLDCGRAARRSLVLEQPVEHVDGRMERTARRADLLFAVPAAVVHLVAQQPIDDPLNVLAEVGADGHGPPLMHGSTSPPKKGRSSYSQWALSSTSAIARLASSLDGSSPSSRRSRSVNVVEVHSGMYVPPPHLPSVACSARSRAPHPSVATFARSATTSSPGASTRSRMTCQRIAGSESSNQSITFTRPWCPMVQRHARLCSGRVSDQRTNTRQWA